MLVSPADSDRLEHQLEKTLDKQVAALTLEKDDIQKVGLYH